MTEFFHQWFEARRPELLLQEGVSLDVSPTTQGLTHNSVHADLRSKRYEWTAQIWENGLSDFHFLDWEAMDHGVKTVHYQFETEQELSFALEAMLKRMHLT